MINNDNNAVIFRYLRFIAWTFLAAAKVADQVAGNTNL